MAKYKQSEFAALCGIPKTSIPAYKSRKQIIVGDDGLVDDTDPVNLAFLIKYQGKQKLNSQTPVESKSEENKTDLTITTTASAGKNKNKNKGSSYHELELQKKALDIEKTQQEIELLAKKNMKMDGESMPTEIVKSIVSVYGKNLTVSFHNVSENWLTRIALMVGLNDAQLAEMRLELSKGTNEAVMKAQIETKKSINSIVKEYSLKREVGEHD